MQPAPLPQGRGWSRTLSTSSTRPCWPSLRDEPQVRQDASPTQSANDGCDSAPEELRRIFGSVSPSCLSARRVRVSEWTARGGDRDGPAGPPPPFMVVVKGAPREARLERSPALRWLRREVGPACRPKATSTGALPWCAGPKTDTPSSRRERLCDPRFQAEITSFSRLPPRDPEARFSLPGGNASRARGVEGSFAGILRPYSWGFLHSTMFTGTPHDRASPWTSLRAPRLIT